jgi:filamentous hemagglutinin family protein
MPRKSSLALAVAAALAFPAWAQQGPAPGTVPVPQPGGRMTNATVGSPFVIPGGQRIDVFQSASRALIDWQSFNLAKGSIITFDQANSQYSILNNILQGTPSQIFGQISGKDGGPTLGTIYLINQNGIVFGPDSQVNVRGLVASTLNLNVDPVTGKSFFSDGTSAVINGTPAFTGTVAGSQVQLLGNITTASGGSVMVFAPSITNQGRISAPDGQVILAAGDTVWLASSTDISMRGIVVEYRAASGTAPANYSSTSSVTNLGEIVADRGNITLGALAINQQGRVSASSAAFLNGSVWLLSSEGGPNSGVSGHRGMVTLGASSTTETPPDTTDTTTVTQDQSQTHSNIQIVGQTIVVQGKVSAPGGDITLDAADPDNSGATNTSRIYVDSGATITAAGDWVNKPASGNLLTIQVTSNELKDAPLLKGTELQGSKVVVDVTRGTPLFDITPFVNGQQRSVLEKDEAAGTISLRSQGDVVLRPGSLLDVSGGGERYAAGATYTTKLVSGGKIYDISQATPNRTYQLLDSFTKQWARWNISETFLLSQLGGATYSSADVAGASAGTISIIATSGALEGELRTNVTAGNKQLASNKLAAGGGLIVGDSTTATTTQNYVLSTAVLGSGIALAADFTPSSPLPANLTNKLYLPSSLFKGNSMDGGNFVQQGFSSVGIFTNDSISLGAGQSIVLPGQGSLTLTSRAIDIEGTLSVPAGSITLSAAPTSSGTPLSVTVGSSGALLARGQWMNQTPAGVSVAGASAFLPGSVNGGSIKVGAGTVSGTTASSGNLLLAPGSVLDASAGARLSPSGSLTGGNGGTINLQAGVGGMQLDGSSLRAAGFSGGGTLSLTAPSVRIGTPTGTPGELALNPSLFERGGFSQFNLTAASNVTLVAGTAIHPMDGETLVLNRAAATSQPSGADLSAFSSSVVLIPSVRPAAGLKITAGSNVTVGLGASITLDPAASLAMTSGNNLEIAGSVSAPAGSVTLTVNGNSLSSPGNLLIDPSATISAPGYFAQTPSTTPGVVKGSVLAGGSIALAATEASVVISQGALLDVSGAAADIDIAAAGAPSVRTHVTSDAGTITVTATLPTRVDGTLRGVAQGTSAGGTFALDLKANLNDPLDTSPRRLIVGATPVATGSTPLQGSLANGPTPVDAYFSASSLQGIDKLRLHAQDQIQFAGDLSLSLGRSVRLDSPEFVAAPGTHTVSLSAPQIALGGTPLVAPAAPAAGTMGSGTASLVLSTGTGSSGLVEVFGYTRLPGFGAVSLSSGGDLRFTGIVASVGGFPASLSGSLWTSGNVSLTAAQIYPATFTSFTLGVDSPTGVLAINGNGAPQAPVYSAGGSLTLQAASIEQGGVVKAPLGQLAFNAANRVDLLPGSVTSVSGDGLTIPYGGTQAGVTWNYAGVPVSAPPAKSIALTAPNVSVQPGATLNLSGGGEISGTEWIQGPGGSNDFLAGSGVYAVIPGIIFTPADTHIAGVQNLGFSNDNNVYNSVYLSGGAGLPAGTYALLPGYYALLPGAYVVQPQKGYTDLAPGQAAATALGSIVSGYRTVAGTDIRESRTSGFLVQPGAQARNQAEYTSSTSDFFTQQAAASGQPRPVLPIDAGTLVLNAAQNLQLGGQLQLRTAPGGAGGALDIVSSNIAIGSGQAAPSGYLQLNAADLSASGARLLIGGSTDGAGNLNVSAANILVQNDATTPLVAPEIILAATGSLTLSPNSVLLGTGSYSGPTSDLKTNGPGALLRAASGPALSLSRTNPLAGGGSLVVGTGATVHGDQAVLLDSTGTSTLAGSVSVGAGGTLDIGGPRVSLGQVPAGVTGLALNPDQLAAASGAANLVLRSYSSIDLYGNATIGGDSLSSLTLRSGGLGGYGGGTVTITADTIQVDNRVGGIFSGTPTGSTALNLSSRRFVLGDGAGQVLQGFGSVNISATQSFVAVGAGSLAVSGNLNVAAGRIVAGTGLDANGATTASNQSISAANVVLAQPVAPVASTDPLTPGGHLSFSGATLTDSTSILLPSGVLSLSASGDLVLATGSVTSAAAYTKDFFGTTAVTDAGTVSLSSSTGNVILQPGASVDVSAPSGGNAGTLSLSAIAAGKTVQLSGTLLGGASAGFTGGNAQLDAGSLPAFSSLNSTLASGGFNGSLSFRTRSADMIVGANDTVAANQVTLIADAGSIAVNGTINTSGLTGGRVELDAANLLSLAAGSRVLATGTSTGTGASDPYSNGGLVRLSSRSASGVTLNFDQAATIDVSAGAKGDAGHVEFYTTRTPTANANLQGTVVGNAGQNAGAASGQVAIIGNEITTIAAGGVTLAPTQGITGISRAATAVVTYAGADTYTAGDHIWIQGAGGMTQVNGREFIVAAVNTTANTFQLRDLNNLAVNSSTFTAYTSGGTLSIPYWSSQATNPLWASYSQFMTGGAASSAQSAFRNSLHLTGVPAANVTMRAGIELQSPGDLTLSGPWDLTNASNAANGGWYIGTTPGVVTLRAAGTLDIRATLGLPNPTTVLTSSQLYAPETIPTTQTWSIQLSGGADFTSANRLAVKPLSQLATTGDVTLTVVPSGTGTASVASTGEQVRVRTGTGDIEVAAGRDFKFVNTTIATGDQLSRDLINGSRAAIYTTGTPIIDPTTGLPLVDTNGGGNRFLNNGGDVRIYAQRDADGFNLDNVKVSGWSTSAPDVTFNQINQPFVGDWLRRTTSSFQQDASGWWVDRRLFSGGIGSFGGGDISIAAGRDVNRLSAMNVSSARVTGTVGNRALTVQGGGSLLVRAGGDVYGGDYLVANNTGLIDAGGIVGRDARTALYLMGFSTDPARDSASIAVDAVSDIRIQNISNPTLLSSSLQTTALGTNALNIPSNCITVNNCPGDGFGSQRPSFISYSPTDQVSLVSAGGSIDLDGTPRVARVATNYGLWFNVAPPKLSLIAMNGKVFDSRLGVDGKLNAPSADAQRLFPSVDQSLQVLAGGDIFNIRFEADDALPSTLPAWNSPLHTGQDSSPSVGNLKLFGTAVTQRLVTPSTTTGYAYDLEAQGSVYDVELFAPQPSRVQAGLDIDNAALSLQNLATSDVSVVKAGRDIRYELTYRTGKQASSNGGFIFVGGPGTLLVQAGRNINLGTTSGIQARGTQDNASLAAAILASPITSPPSATLDVVAGYTGPLVQSDIDALFPELLAAGSANVPAEQRAAMGDAAVASILKPQFTSTVGNVTMYQSTVQTNGGSAINILVPSGAPNSPTGGNLNAGLPVANTSGQPIGIVTQNGGAISVYTQNDFVVNQSKVLTQLGGDILAYSSYGSIDAGRGALSARTFRDVARTTLPDGTVIITPPSSGFGSGIRTFSFDPDGPGPLSAPRPGDVFLFAPRGTINAGEAGIASAGNVFVFALQILNAQNISAQGTSTGVPVAVQGSLAASLAGATSSASSAVQSAVDSLQAAKAVDRPATISVRVLGFGDDN